MSRPLCGTAAILNRPSCHNLLCTILDLADTRNPELYCVAVTVRNPSLLAKTAPAAESEWCLSRSPQWTDGSASPAGCNLRAGEQQRSWHAIQSHRRSIKKGEDMTLRNQRLAEIREHIKAESSHDMPALLAGMTSDCFNDVAAVRSRFEARNESLSATENIGQAFLILRFALSGYLLSERAPLLPKTNGAEPISASSSAIRRPASTSGYELWWYGISNERDCGEKQSFSTWGAF